MQVVNLFFYVSCGSGLHLNDTNFCVMCMHTRRCIRMSCKNNNNSRKDPYQAYVQELYDALHISDLTDSPEFEMLRLNEHALELRLILVLKAFSL